MRTHTSTHTHKCVHKCMRTARVHKCTRTNTHTPSRAHTHTRTLMYKSPAHMRVHMHAQVAPALPTLVALFVANALFAAGDAVWESQVSSTPPIGGRSPACFALPSVCRWMPRMRRSHRFSSPSSTVRPSRLLLRTGVRLRHAMPRHATRWHGNHAGPFGGQRRSLINCDEVMRSAGLSR